MSFDLSALRNCFEGVIPGSIATLGADGMPNISFLSQVFYVDERHVALSNQFFSKTAQNTRRTGRATAMVVDGGTGAQYILDLAYTRSQTDGDLFARMAAHLRAITTQHGLDGVMRLTSAEVYEVLAVQSVPGPERAVGHERAAPARPPLVAAAQAAQALAAADDADRLIDVAVDQLTGAFGFRHVMLLTPDPTTGALVTLASRGYETIGVGSEVASGQGVIGIAAETGQPVRICEMSRGRRMAEAVRDSSAGGLEREIPLPGLAEPQSQIAVPMLARGRLMGVLFAEDAHRFRFDWQDEAAVGLVATQLAQALRLAEAEGQPERPAPRSDPSPTAAGATFQVRYYPFDDSLFLDDAYLIKGVPGRLLFHFLKAYQEDGRLDFTNREIRLDASLRLPGLKDNLETRLILLRRRLEEKAAPVQLERPERGRIRLALSGQPVLEVVD